MSRLGRRLGRVWERAVLGHPALALAAVAALVAVPLAHLPDFRVEASSDSIVLEGDAALRFYSEVRREFGGDDALFVAITPEGPLFSSPTLEGIAGLVERIESIDGVDSVTSLLSVPLFHSPDVGLLSLAEGYRTLADPQTPLDLAERELTTSPLYADLLVSEDGQTTALEVRLVESDRLAELDARREELRELEREGALDSAGRGELARVEEAYRDLYSEVSSRRRADVAELREVLDGARDLGEIRLGGTPMIVADIVAFIERDMVVFGVAVAVFVLLVMVVLFRSVRWVVAPTAVCALTVLTVMGLLGMMDWRTTIVTSNLGSLLFILTMAMAIHVAVRHREQHADDPEVSARELMLRTVRWVARPCLYTALTTIVGFGSLYVSGIRPVMDFALMMALGIGVGFALTFTALPAAMVLVGKGPAPRALLGEGHSRALSGLARLAERRPRWIVAVALGLVPLGFLGAARLEVENRFIDYFQASTEIHRGMTFLDQRLGGTTPLEIVVDLEVEDGWLEKENLDRLAALHDWLAAQPEVGKVLSLATLVRVLEGILENTTNPLIPKTVDAPLLRLLRERVSAGIARTALDPYVSADYRRARIAARVRETSEELDRQDLLRRIERRLEGGEAAFPPEATRVTGLFVLYNNLLQSLFSSQVQTLAAVAVAIWAMLWLLFRSPLLALAGLLPNLLPVIVVLGALGWLGIPLDLMTIMIAAVTLGIAVDDTVHYLHRFRSEVAGGRSYAEALHRSHNTVGRAVAYTSIAVIFGFSILVASNFWPTIYFGLFTGLAMLVALAGALTLLPVLLLAWRPVPRGE